MTLAAMHKLQLQMNSFSLRFLVYFHFHDAISRPPFEILWLLMQILSLDLILHKNARIRMKGNSYSIWEQ